MLFSSFFQIYRISCSVQFLHIKFQKMLHFTFQFICFVLYASFTPITYGT